MLLHPASPAVGAPSADATPAAIGAGLAERCEEVRAHLVAARGGAPFLSGADGRLVVRWVEGGVPVPAILSAIDAAVEKRRRRPVRGRLSLSACAKELGAWSAGTPARASASGAAVAQGAHIAPSLTGDSGGAALTALVHEERARAVPAVFARAHAALLRALVDAAAPGSPVEGAATAAARAIRSFHDACWDALGAEQATLLASATESLAPLREAMGPSTFDELVLAEAKDRLRAQFPQLSARAVWERMVPGGAA